LETPGPVKIFLDQARLDRNVRFDLIAAESMRRKNPPLCATTGLKQRSNEAGATRF